MFRAMALVGIAGALAACDLVVQQAEERAAAEIGNAAAELATNFSVNVGPELMKHGKVNLSGVELLPGATVTGFNMTGGTGGPTVRVSFEAPTSPEQVKAYFLREFEAKQVAVQQTAQAISGVTREGNGFRIDLAPGGGGTRGTIEIDPGSGQR